MDTNLRNQDQNESNAGAGMNDNAASLHKAVRTNAGHPGDASHAAGMRRNPQDDQDASQEAGRDDANDSAGTDPHSR